MTGDLICPKCGDSPLMKWGFTTNHGSRRQRYHCKFCKHKTTTPRSPSDPVLMRDKAPKAKRYVITAAQNATPVFEPFWKALLQYCKRNGAELLVIPIRYKNPTSQWTQATQEHEWWVAEVLPYLFNGRIELAGSLVILGDVKVQPTAVSPLMGLDTITSDKSGVVGHTKLELKTIATPQHQLPKLMTTTGAVTIQNYTDTKAGKKGEFHHAFGACVVELRGKAFHVRQINATKDGSFIDLDREYHARGSRKAPPAQALIMGDTHVDFIDPAVDRATFGEDSMLHTLKPKTLIWHDLLDFYSRNHHHRGDPFIGIAKQQSGHEDVKAEIERACEFIKNRTPTKVNSVIIPSNHNDALTRWLKEADWKTDPINAETYLETALAVVRSVEMTECGSKHIHPFAYWCNKILGDSVKILERDDSFTVADIELGLHGDKGINGARGSAMSISKIGVKTVIGHSHSPAIRDGCYQVGTSTRLRVEYNSGPSSWLNTHCVIYANGKRSLINIIDGRWRAP